MAEGRRITAWAKASVMAGSIGCALSAALPPLSAHAMTVDPTGVGAGAAILLCGSIAGLLCLGGVASGVVALRKIRSGLCSGRGLAWIGIVLSLIPVAVFFCIL